MNRKNFIKLSTLAAMAAGVNLSAYCTGKKEDGVQDVAVIGGTPAGIMAAIAAARLGCRVTLTEYHGHIGGMSTSGLGKSDIENKDAIAGLFKEFTKNIKAYYVTKYGEGTENVAKCKDGYYYEPSVAEKVFNDMLRAEKNIRVLVNHQLEKVQTDAGTVKEVQLKNRANNDLVVIKATVFIDATYEGDVYAKAGAAYALGREGKDEYNEEHAGKIFFDYDNKVFLEGSTGEADKNLPAYTYRLCLTDDPANSYVLQSPPDEYDRNLYIPYFNDLKEGRLGGPKVFQEGHGYYAAHFNTMVRVFSFAEIPNRKYDVNINPRPLGFPFPGENTGYVEADWEQREKVFRRHRNLTLGLLYFIQNDPEIPEAHRKLARQYHLPLDEFRDNGHFPWQLYVREGRRLKGKYTLTENDVRLKKQGRNTVFGDSIMAGEFPIDSFPVTTQPSADKKVLEGYIGLLPVSPYQIPYRILIPEKIKGLIVPVAVSTTHVAYSTVRMEPLWMGLGQVAGTAAAMALMQRKPVSDLQPESLQLKLLEYKQILSYFNDVPISDKAFQAVQFWGTKGFFSEYAANPHEPVFPDTLSAWHSIFNQLMKQEDPAPEISGNTVSIRQFTRHYGSSFNMSRHLYEIRDEDSPVLRGEACLYFFERYAQLKKDAL
jgi:hypothetical protein